MIRHATVHEVGAPGASSGCACDYCLRIGYGAVVIAAGALAPRNAGEP